MLLVPVPATETSHRILVVEDEGLVALDICKQLGQLGFVDVKTARSGEKALQLLKEFQPDLALLDIRIEGDMDGVELAELLRKEGNTPVIFMTAFADDETVDRAKPIEPYGYLLKPVDPLELGTAVQMALYRHEKEQERKLLDAEAQEFERQMLHSQKMEAVGTLSAGLAHELNNTLMAIIGNIDLACTCALLSDQTRKRLGLALDGCDRAAHLLQQLLGFARQGRYQPESLLVKEQLSSTLDFLAPVLGKNVSVSFPHARPDMWISADRHQFEQIVTNLALNAQQAMHQRGRLDFDLERKYFETPESHNSDALPGYYVGLSVRDTGHGMSRELIAQIFEPFFSTKQRWEGTGLGLSVVYGVMQHHGGWVEVSSTLGVGSCFTLWFPEGEPVSRGKRLRRGSGSLQLAPEPVPATVLVIDDEPVIANVVSEYLIRAGFQAVPYCEPYSALSWYAGHFAEVDLILLDMKMPSMSGSACFKAIRKLNPDAACFLLSGHTQDQTVGQLLSEGALGFFAKPVDFDALIHTLGEFSKTQLQSTQH